MYTHFSHSAQDGGKLSASRFGRFYPRRKRISDSRWIVGRIGSSTGLDAVV